MVENILSFSKINTGLKIDFKIELVEELLENALHAFKMRYQDARVLVQIPDEILFVNVDRKLICQVLINLLENAHVHGKSNVPILFYIDYDKKNVYIKVKDSGVGITDDVYKYLNEILFFSNDNENKYKGIGLSVSNTIAKLHGGIIEANNNDDCGAIFTLKLNRVINDEK